MIIYFYGNGFTESERSWIKTVLIPAIKTSTFIGWHKT